MLSVKHTGNVGDCCIVLRRHEWVRKFMEEELQETSNVVDIVEEIGRLAEINFRSIYFLLSELAL
jgi:hypothetical protein